jgi:hypothetical protein
MGFKNSSNKMGVETFFSRENWYIAKIKGMIIPANRKNNWPQEGSRKQQRRALEVRKIRKKSQGQKVLK